MAEETIFLEFMGAKKDSINGKAVTISCLTRNGREEIRRIIQTLGLKLRTSGNTLIVYPNDKNRFRIEMPLNGQGKKDCQNNLTRLAEALEEETYIVRLVTKKAPATFKAPKRKRGRKYRNTHGQFR